MTTALTREDAEKLVAAIGIPPRPTVVIAIQDEKSKHDPDMRVIADAIGRDVGIAAALLKTVNSPFFGLPRPVQSVSHAVNLLGLARIATLANSLALKTTLNAHGIERFWDQSARIALVSGWLARKFGHDPDAAHLFGLFRDAGIPLMMKKFPSYKDTLRRADEAGADFIAVEDAAHGVNHTQVGALIARNWYLADDIRHAIAGHHDADLFTLSGTPSAIKNLIAVAHLAGHLENLNNRKRGDNEWLRHHDTFSSWLMIGDEDVDDMAREAVTLMLEAGL